MFMLIRYRRELKIDDAATPRCCVNVYQYEKAFWNLITVVIVKAYFRNLQTVLFVETMRCQH